MPISVYGKPNCPPCSATVRWLDKRGIPFTYWDVSEDHEALQFVLGLGVKETPVVVHETGHFTGYRPDRLKEVTDGNLSI